MGTIIYVTLVVHWVLQWKVIRPSIDYINKDSWLGGQNFNFQEKLGLTWQQKWGSSWQSPATQENLVMISASYVMGFVMFMLHKRGNYYLMVEDTLFTIQWYFIIVLHLMVFFKFEVNNTLEHEFGLRCGLGWLIGKKKRAN